MKIRHNLYEGALVKDADGDIGVVVSIETGGMVDVNYHGHGLESVHYSILEVQDEDDDNGQ